MEYYNVQISFNKPQELSKRISEGVNAVAISFNNRINRAEEHCAASISGLSVDVIRKWRGNNAPQSTSNGDVFIGLIWVLLTEGMLRHRPIPAARSWLFDLIKATSIAQDMGTKTDMSTFIATSFVESVRLGNNSRLREDEVKKQIEHLMSEFYKAPTALVAPPNNLVVRPVSRVDLIHCLNLLKGLENHEIYYRGQETINQYEVLSEEALRHRVIYLAANTNIDFANVDSFAVQITDSLENKQPITREMISHFGHEAGNSQPASDSSIANLFHDYYTGNEEISAESIGKLKGALFEWEYTLKNNRDWTHVQSIVPNKPYVPIQDIFTELYFVDDNNFASHYDQSLKTHVFSTPPNREKIDETFATAGYISLDKLFTRLRRRTVLIGEPGSGKSTLVKWIAQSIINHTITDFIIPIVIPLRTLADYSASKQVRSVFDYFFQVYCNVDQETAGSLDRTLQKIIRQDKNNSLRGQCILLMLDGWDEVPQTQRANILSMINRDCKDFPTIITTRPSGVPGSLMGEQVFRIGSLSPASFHALVQSHCDFIGKPELGHEIITQVNLIPALQRVAGNPYLLTLLCEVSALNQNEIPTNTTDIFIQAIKLIQRDQSTVVELPPLDENSLLNIAHIAFQMSFPERRSSKRYTFTSVQTPYLDNSKFQDSAAAHSRMISKLQNHFDTYTFVHARFQEFFAARQLVSLEHEQYLNIISQHILLEPWLEEQRFAVGLADQQHLQLFCSLIREHIADPDYFGFVYRFAARLLAVLAPQDGGKKLLGQDLRDQLWSCMLNDLQLEESTTAYIELDAADVVYRIKANPVAVKERERLVETVYRRLPPIMRYQLGFDDWLSSQPRFAWAIGMSSFGVLLHHQIVELRTRAQNEDEDPGARAFALRQLAAIRDKGIVDWLIIRLEYPDHPLFEEIILTLGRIGGSLAAMALARLLIRPLPDPSAYIEAISGLQVDGYGAIEPNARDFLLKQLALLEPENMYTDLILQALANTTIASGGQIILDILKSPIRRDIRQNAVKALMGVLDEDVIKSAFEIARETDDPKLQIFILRILRHHPIPNNPEWTAWLQKQISDEKTPTQQRKAAFYVAVRALKRKSDSSLLKLVEAILLKDLNQLAQGQETKLTDYVIEAVDILPDPEVGVKALISALRHETLTLETHQHICEKIGQLRLPSAIDGLKALIIPYHEAHIEPSDENYRFLRVVAKALAQIAPLDVLELAQLDAGFSSPVMEALEDLASQQGYRIYSDRILDENGRPL